MMAILKRYPTYKDSGIEWLGVVPEEWDIQRIKYRVDTNAKSLPEDTVPDYCFRYVDIGNVDQGHITVPPEPIFFAEAPSRARRIAVQGDTIVSTVRTYLKAIAFVDYTGNDLVVSTGFAVLTPRKSDIPKYVYYLMSCEKVIDTICSFSVGVSYPAINSSDLISMPLWFPPKREQQAITEFLDQKTARIDDLIAKKQRQIELLKEQRQAVINQAVTKGLNPDVRVKDTGIEWFGKIPKHWEVKKFKFLLKRQKSAIKTGPFGSQLKSTDFIEQGIKVYNQRSVLDNDFENGEIFISPEKYEELRAFEVFPDDILITTRGTIGKCAIFPSNAEKGVLHPCLIRMQLDQSKILNEYVVWYIQESSFFQENVHYNSDATTIAVIYSETLKDVQIPTPPLAEQQDILMFIKQEAEGIQNTVDKAEKQIQLLQEYRTALISETVTGKIMIY